MRFAMSLIQALLLLLVLSQVLCEIATRLGQLAILGEIAAGIIPGLSCLGYIQFTPEIKAIADTGVLLGVLFGMDDMRIAFLGLCIAITALPVSVRILMDLGRLKSDIGQKVVSAAVANDFVSLLILGVILDLKNAPGTLEQFLMSIGESLGKALLFMIVFAIAARLIRRYSPTRLLESSGPLEGILTSFKGDEVRFATILLFVIAFASFSEILGLDFVVGAFFGSMLLSHEALGKENFKKIEQTASSVTMGFVGPVFFAAIGLEFNAASLKNWPLAAAVLIVSLRERLSVATLEADSQGLAMPPVGLLAWDSMVAVSWNWSLQI
jgi:Kef-type K+ transport system membrane component KefB